MTPRFTTAHPPADSPSGDKEVHRLPARLEVTIASQNTRGVPLWGSDLAGRYARIADLVEKSAIDIVCLQEVFTYAHLRLLARATPSFRFACYRPTPVGPAGGLVTLSRRPAAAAGYHRLPVPRRAPGIPVRRLLRAAVKGALLTRLTGPELTILNTHPVANEDGDWSPSNRFHVVHEQQLVALADIIRAGTGPTVVCGDFNVDRDSELFTNFIARSGLIDVFGGLCPPTFRAEYLPPGEDPRCIDFILACPQVDVEAADVLDAGAPQPPNRASYVSDHIGLQARLTIMR